MKSKQFKTSKGITLVALVVTVVVLLILAGVSLNLVLGNSGIVKKSKESKTNYTNSSIEEQNTLNKTSAQIDVATNGEPILTIAQAQDATAMKDNTENSTVKDTNGKIFTVPAGFYVTNDANDVTKGVVITDGTNEFVWVPVADSSKMYTAASANLCKATSQTETITTNYYSKFRINTGDLEIAAIPGNTNQIREPDLVVGTGTGYDASSSNEKTAGYLSTSEMAQAFVDDYKAMIDSVNSYHGFYVGRYELTGTTSNPTEKKGTTLVDLLWYGAYNICKKVESTSHAQTSMIWGCQWDEIMSWLISSGAKTDNEVNTDSSSWGNYGIETVDEETDETVITGSIIATGSNPNYKANNIYDLAGNVSEYTQEAMGTFCRIARGGQFNYGPNHSVSSRYSIIPNNATSKNTGPYCSSRATLYIK